MAEQQNNIVTLTKAIGIILMVFAHAMSPEHVVWRAIYTFHMPLFFIMSGYCFKEKYLDDPKQFVVRKIKGIYVPFVLFSLMFLALHNVFCRLYIYEPTWLYGWKNYLWETGRIVTRMSHAGGMFGTAWFLKELFWGNMIFYAALWGWRRLKWKHEPLLVSLLVLAEIMCVFHLRIPYFNVTYASVRTAFFIAFGYLWRQREWKLNKWAIWLVGVLCIIGELLMGNAGYLELDYIRLLVYVVPAILGTLCVFELCKLVETYANRYVVKPLGYVGEHTLSIMVLHLLSFKLVTYIIIRMDHLPIDRLYEFPVLYDYTTGWGAILAYTLVGICVPLLCAWGWQYLKCKVESVECNNR